MSLGDVSLACASALVDELVRGGMTHACLSPGSRSTPLALALSRDGRVRLHVHLDERSSAFFALGLAKFLGQPVAVACTSGTAAAELWPAVVEASQSRVPLLLLTADRPPRLRGTGANQTIDQVELFGRFARGYMEMVVPADAEDVAAWRTGGRDALAATRTGMAGPVQVNCPFEEPLMPSDAPSSTRAPVSPTPPTDEMEEPDDGTIEALAAAVDGRRGVVVLGASARAESGEAGSSLGAALGWPVIAEPASLARRPGRALGAGQALLGSARWLAAHPPEVVVQVGAFPTTRAAQTFAAGAADLVVIDAHHLEPDPAGRATLRIRRDIEGLDLPSPSPTPGEWLDSWRLADVAARRVVDDLLDRSTAPTELQVARDTAATIPIGGTLFVGNSMPIRDLDLAMAPRDGLRVLANRGASGIDGLVSTAMGVATADPAPTVALLGDLSLLYDAGALLWNGRQASDLTIVVPNNGGGQIFATLGQGALAADELSRLFTTPHVVDLGTLCAAAGAAHTLVGEVSAFGPALEHAMARGGIHVFEVAVDPDRSRAQRVQVQDAVDAALSSLV